MPESRSGVSAFETRLAAMDRRLRELQEELAPAGTASESSTAEPDGAVDPPEPRASIRPAAIPAPPPMPTDPASERPVARPDLLAALYDRLLASTRELLAGYELVAAVGVSGPAGGVSGPGRVPGPEPAEVAVSAGPFSGTPALRDFERALSDLPGVRAVSLRGYDSDDRAVWDVRLR